MKTSESVDKILPALAEVKANLTGVKKGVKNTFFKSSYADLNTHLDAVEELLEQHGLILLQPITNTAEGNVVSSRIYHAGSGQFVESTMKLVGEIDMQKSGSAVTYARRYTLGSLLAMKAVDDDGNVASGKGPKVEQTVTSSNENTVKTAPANRPSFRDRVKPKPQLVQTPTDIASGDDL